MALLKRIFLNEWSIVWAISMNSIVVFSLGFESLHFNKPLIFADHFFTLFFLVELIVKVKVYGWKNYINSFGNKFDVLLVLISLPSVFEIFVDLPDFSYLLVFRLLRVFRILRFMRFIPNIKQMIAGIQRAIRASAFVFAALMIYNILLAILSSYFFGRDVPEYFGNPLISAYTIFQIFTLEGWYEIPSAIAEVAGPDSWKPALARLFFLSVVLTGSIFGFSILNAIFVDEMVMDNNDELSAKVDELNEKLDRLLANSKQDNG